MRNLLREDYAAQSNSSELILVIPLLYTHLLAYIILA